MEMAVEIVSRGIQQKIKDKESTVTIQKRGKYNGTQKNEKPTKS